MLSMYSNAGDPFGIESLDIGSIDIDTVLSEERAFTNVIARHKVERGNDNDTDSVVDHIERSPKAYTFTGVTTNTPIFLTRATSEGEYKYIRKDWSNRGLAVYNYLCEIAGYNPDTGEQQSKNYKPRKLTLFTGLTVYNDMYISSLVFPHEKSDGESIRYTIKFEQIRFVVTKYTPAPVKPEYKNKANKKLKTGEEKKKDKVVDPNKSEVVKILDSLRGQ